MNLKKYLCLLLPLAVFTACDIDSQMKDFVVEQPEELNELSYLSSYKTLTSYINLENFKLGTSVAITDYLDPKGMSGVVVNTNFNQVSTPIHMKHKAIVSDKGEYGLDLSEKFIQATQKRGIGVFGFTLCDYTNQNNTYLEKLIEPKFIEDESIKEEVVTLTECFEGGKLENGGDLDALVNKYSGGFQASIANGAGLDGSNCALYKMNNTFEPWTQIIIKLPAGSVIAKDSIVYQFSMDVKTSVDLVLNEVNMRRQGQYMDWNPINFVSPGTTANVWKKLEGEIVLNAVNSNLFEMTMGIAGLGSGGTIHFDNVSLKRKEVEVLNGYYEHKTAEQKDAIITNEMNTWVNKMVGVGGGVITDWVVVNQPLTEKAPFVLRSASLIPEGAEVEGNTFYWNDCMGDDYVCDIVKQARETAAGKELKLFVSEHGLEDAAKCDVLVDQIAKWESDGTTKIDGISAVVNPACDLLSQVVRDAEIEKVKVMFGKLVATGKLIRMSGLDIAGMIGSTEAKLPLLTDEHLAMADFYEKIISAYFEVVPATQRYGISKDSFLDTADKLPYGLWSQNFSRKHTYVGFVKGLENANAAE